MADQAPEMIQQVGQQGWQINLWIHRKLWFCQMVLSDPSYPSIRALLDSIYDFILCQSQSFCQSFAMESLCPHSEEISEVTDRYNPNQKVPAWPGTKCPTWVPSQNGFGQWRWCPKFVAIRLWDMTITLALYISSISLFFFQRKPHIQVKFPTQGRAPISKRLGTKWLNCFFVSYCINLTHTSVFIELPTWMRIPAGTQARSIVIVQFRCI